MDRGARQEYWSGLSFSSPGGLPNPRIEPGSPALQADSLPTELRGKPILYVVVCNINPKLLVYLPPTLARAFPGSSVGKESACNAGDPGSVPGARRSAGEGIDYPLQYSWA